MFAFYGANSHLRQKGKIAELALDYGGRAGALKAMGAIEMGLTGEELQPLVTSWCQANLMIARLLNCKDVYFMLYSLYYVQAGGWEAWLIELLSNNEKNVCVV